MLKYIKFRIHGGQKDEDGVTRRADIRMIESTMTPLECNELPIILNALAGTKDLVEERQNGFPYTFPMTF
ncbi:hypothetical protein AAE250_20865 [Bacteroides sp. GD17]|jgi:hypothetical protein|uniref:hypothetical protein n=1 Tax=Bacteroides sp. GD17 TaxID=3139826 RepID=UPI002058A9BA|nr:hypothetical protein [uncultured Bacteroides sp.]DAV89752.1 MAG TPA: hypothetical protein [Caudoviricetes sp.]